MPGWLLVGAPALAATAPEPAPARGPVLALPPRPLLLLLLLPLVAALAAAAHHPGQSPQSQPGPCWANAAAPNGVGAVAAACALYFDARPEGCRLDCCSLGHKACPPSTHDPQWPSRGRGQAPARKRRAAARACRWDARVRFNAGQHSGEAEVALRVGRGCAGADAHRRQCRNTLHEPEACLGALQHARCSGVTLQSCEDGSVQHDCHPIKYSYSLDSKTCTRVACRAGTSSVFPK